MYPWYTDMAGQQHQPQANQYLVVHGQHYVYMSTTPLQSVAVPYTPAGQTPIKLETSPTLPMPATPQMIPKSDKMNSDSKKDEEEHVSSKHSKNIVVKVLRCNPDSELQSLQSCQINAAHYKPITPSFHVYGITLGQ